VPFDREPSPLSTPSSSTQSLSVDQIHSILPPQTERSNQWDPFQFRNATEEKEQNVLEDWTDQDLAQLQSEMQQAMFAIAEPTPKRDHEKKTEYFLHSLSSIASNEASKVNNELDNQLKESREENERNLKELSVWKGVEVELKKMDLENLHELETNMIESLQKIRKVINQKRERENECRVCRDKPKDTVLFPCGHRLCSGCVVRLEKCPMCRAEIENSVKIL